MPALDEGVLNAALAAHLESCDACQEARLAWTALRDVAGIANQARLPSAGFLWWKAQIEIKREAAERSVRVIRWMDAAAAACAVAGAAAALVYVGGNSLKAALAGAAMMLLVAGAAAIYRAALRRV